MKIGYLQLYTSKLQEQRKFYEDVLKLQVENASRTSFKVQLGYSVLEFQQQDAATPYHIAFHISDRKEEQALKWLKERVSILTNEGEDIVDFPAWNAKSIYFYDADKNVVEFISRRNFFNEKTSKFSEENILGIAEIGLATNDVKDAFEFLNQHFGLEKFTGDYKTFCATGDDEGLFIVIDKNSKEWFPSNDKAFASEFKISFSTASGESTIAYTNERLQLL